MFIRMTVLTCAGHCGGVFSSSVEALITVTDGGRLVVAGAMQRTLGAFCVPSICFEGAGPTGWRKESKKEHNKFRQLLLHEHIVSVNVAWVPLVSS